VKVTPYLIVFGASAGTAFVATPLVRRFSILVGAIDRPSDRKVHPKPTPTLGGIAIFLALVAGWLVSHQMPFFDRMYRISSEPLGALVAGAVIMAIGAYDDVRGTSVPVKFSGQLLASGLLVLFGVQLLFFWLPGQGILSLGSDLAVPFSILWILAMLNAVNLIDGLDGLAAGLVAVASIAFFAYILLGPPSPFFTHTGTPAALLAAIAAGGALGFLPWNFHPARIFMGDSGAMLLGMLLAAATISGVGRSPYQPSGGDLAAYSIPVLLPLVVLAVPFADVLLAILRRIRRRRRITAPDKEHIHHRLLDFGHSHRQAVLLMYLWSILISGTALAVALINGRLVVGSIALGAAIVIVGTAFPRVWSSRTRQARRAERRAKREAKHAAKGADEPADAGVRQDQPAAVGPAALGAKDTPA
jgi:UDP-GlcNAc:undecaprenyl-phosphate/decaprenyl-phosphate GlcNAc-1-phosphate transferase